MKLLCKQTYIYGAKGRLTTKLAKELDLNPKDYDGGPVKTYEEGETYDVEIGLAVRLLRDHGPRAGRAETAVRFEPADPVEYIRYLQGQKETIPMADALAGALATRAIEEKSLDLVTA